MLFYFILYVIYVISYDWIKSCSWVMVSATAGICGSTSAIELIVGE